MSYDVKEVKDAGDGHWHAIVNRVGGVDDDYLTTRHGPCPRCGGTDRWRVFNDFAHTGGAMCNQCGKFADGVALIMWLLGIGFPDALEKIGVFLGVKPKTKKTKQKGGKRKWTPDEQLEFIQWSDQLAALWCLKKKPATPEAIKQLGGRMARYQGRHTVIAFPVTAEGRQQGWIVYNATGGTLPYKDGEKVEHLKVKVVSGSEKGFVRTDDEGVAK